MFVVLGQDSVAHMAEEVENASTIVPKAMVVSFFFNTVILAAVVNSAVSIGK